MSPILRKLASEPHSALALNAFAKYRGLVLTGILSADEARRSLIHRVATTIPANEAEATIARAFDAAKRKSHARN